MRYSLSEVSTIASSFSEDVDAYAAAGFDAIGIWEFKLPEDDKANLRQLAAHGLHVANCVPVVPSILQLAVPGMEGPADPAERVEALCASIRRLARYEPECVLFLSGPYGTHDPAAARSLVVDGIRAVAKTAAEVGVRAAFEPVHPRDAGTAAFVTSLAEALVLLDEAGADDVGIMLDTYHVWDEQDAAIAACVPRVYGVHVCDQAADPGAGRLLPGTAGGRSREIVELVRAAGWDGSLDVEIFSTPDRFWGLPVAEAARRAYAAVSTLA